MEVRPRESIILVDDFEALLFTLKKRGFGSVASEILMVMHAG
jgi:hypothetical protein